LRFSKVFSNFAAKYYIINLKIRKMKKLSYFGAMLLFAAMTYSCSRIDKPVDPSVIIELDGQKYQTDLVATFQGQVGEEVTLGLGVYDNFDIYGVDFGDGKIVADSVCNQNGGLKGEDGLTKPGTAHKNATEFKGTIAGDGIVKVYGKSDIWYLTIDGNLMPTAFDQPKLANVVQISISGAVAEKIALPALASLKQFLLSNVPVKSLDVSKVTELTSLQVIHTSVSKYDASPLVSIDVTKNTKLTNLQLGNSAYKPGILTALDLTQNPALETIVIGNNKIKDLKLAAAYEKCTVFNVGTNELESLTLPALPALTTFDISKNKIKGDIELTSEKLTTVYVNDNELNSIKLPNVTKYFYLQNNKMTFATLPVLPAGLSTKVKRFTYAPQADMKVAPNGSVLDLSAQASAKGIEAETQATVFSITAGNAALIEGKDYTVKDGVITFITDQKDAIVKMTNAGYPNLNLCTEPFDVKGTGEASSEGTVIFSFFEGNFTGGTAVGNGADEGKVAKEITVSSKKANIDTDNITITLNEALKAGDVIKITGYRKKDSDANGNLYILFETGEVIDEGNDVKWNNVHENVGQQPNTNSYDVNEKAAGSKTIKLARSKSGTNVFIQKIEIIRK
jgi:hypothetical protein